MRKFPIINWLTLALSVAMAAPAFGMATRGHMPRPGLVNSVQGKVEMNGHSVRNNTIPNRMLRPHEILATRHGDAEVLLTPGAFLRIGENSAARMTSETLEDSQVKLIRGKALLKADRVYKHTLSVMMDGATTRINHKGLYEFNAQAKAIAVLHGKATVYQGGSQVTLKKGREVLLAQGQPLYARKFDKHALKSGQLYRWSRLRDRYESQARQDLQQYVAQTGRWHGPGWYWSHYWGFYAYLPSEGAYFSPYYGGPYFSPYFTPYGWGNWGYEGWGWGDDDDD